MSRSLLAEPELWEREAPLFDAGERGRLERTTQGANRAGCSPLPEPPDREKRAGGPEQCRLELIDAFVATDDVVRVFD